MKHRKKITFQENKTISDWDGVFRAFGTGCRDPEVIFSMRKMYGLRDDITLEEIAAFYDTISKTAAGLLYLDDLRGQILMESHFVKRKAWEVFDNSFEAKAKLESLRVVLTASDHVGFYSGLKRELEAPKTIEDNRSITINAEGMTEEEREKLWDMVEIQEELKKKGVIGDGPRRESTGKILAKAQEKSRSRKK